MAGVRNGSVVLVELDSELSVDRWDASARLRRMAARACLTVLGGKGKGRCQHSQASQECEPSLKCTYLGDWLRHWAS